MSCTYIFYGLTVSIDNAKTVQNIVRKHTMYRKMHSEDGYQHTNEEDATRPSFTVVSSYNRDDDPTAFYYYIDEFESGYVDDDESVAAIDPRKMIAFENLSSDAVKFMEDLDEYIHAHINVKTSVGWFMVACDFNDDGDNVSNSDEGSSDGDGDGDDACDDACDDNCDCNDACDGDDPVSNPVTDSSVNKSVNTVTIANSAKSISEIVTNGVSTVIDMVSKFVESVTTDDADDTDDTVNTDDTDNTDDTVNADNDDDNVVTDDNGAVVDVNDKLLRPHDLTN